MSSNSDLTAPGSSTYASNTLHVGDGTWDNGRDTFLLPNLMGLNFDTMRYNGMGNRFREMPQYRTLIIAHGVIATIVFLGLVPMSILTIRYFSRWSPFWAFKLHVWCQVLTLLLSTVVFVLGLTLWGSPKSLFILYSIAVFALLVAFFVLSYLYDTEGYHPGGTEYDGRHSYVSGPPGPDDRRHNSFGRAFATLKNMFNRRKGDPDQRRMEEMRRQDMEDERLQRANSKRRYTGDGYYPRGRADSFTATDLSSDMTRPPRGPSHGPPLGESALTGGPTASGPVDGAHSDMPPVPPTQLTSELPAPDPSRPTPSDFAAGATAGSALGGPSSHRRRRSSSRRRDDHVDSPPVSVKVKMHDDGRHVTLRRLTEEEAAANREARRRERRNSRRRAGSTSSLSGGEGSYDRWRRVEELEREQQEQMRREQAAAAAAAPSGTMPPASYAPPPSNMSHMAPPPPPPPPAGAGMPYGAGSITSPGTYTGTEASGDYANNRRRRRAERARARQDRQHSVEFT
ncbi:hypothetical protein N8T08_011035 [Aspergillus melleus]|uniref:Uncharacterized protein n=1 Tax=Aspergillus melleus TaxID=138277 RepID=A0ACC3AQS8_9EURO|nr:hypothetical protein N8T08_011035 [Aspergillus melleus]